MQYLSYDAPDPGRRYEPHVYTGRPAGQAGNGPRHRVEDPDSAPEPVVREHPEPQPGGFAQTGRRWPMIADDFFFVAHDDWPHKLRLHRDVARLGLGAAVVAELLMAQYVDIRHDALIALVAGRPADQVAARLMTRLSDELGAVPVRDWLAYLADAGQPDGDIYDQVGRRMVLAKKVEAERTGLLRRSIRYVPMDINAAAWPWARLSQQLERGTQLDDADTVLGGLLLATGLHAHVLIGDVGPLESRLRRNIAAAPVAVRELLRHTETAVGAAVITGA